MTTLSPPYAHLPTSITTSQSLDPCTTTTTQFMPSVGAIRFHHDRLYVKNAYGWWCETAHEYADKFTALLCDGWTVTTTPRTGDIALGHITLTPPTGKTS